MDKKVLIALTTSEVIRKSIAISYFLNLDKPLEFNPAITTVHGQSPAEARNHIFKMALDNNFTHVLLCDDDMAFPPDTLTRLMAHDKDVVTGLYLKRDFPHIPCLFDDVAGDEGYCKFMLLTGDNVPKEELIRVTNMGFGAVLIKTAIFDKLTEYEPFWVTLGEIQKDGWCDDVAFFNKCRKAGVELYCDMSLQVGHMTTVTIFPKYVNGTWYTEYQSPTGGCLIPQHVVATPDTQEAGPVN